MKSLLIFFIFCTGTSLTAQVISPGLTAVYEHQRHVVKLKWNHNDKRIVSYTLQKSANNTSWISMHRILISKPQQYKFISYSDETPGEGRNYYRLQFTLQDGSVNATPSIMVIMGKPGNNWLMYPVPAKDVLHLQYNGNALIDGVISIIIQNAGGRVFHQLRFASSTRLIRIPVNNLVKGIYDVRIIVANKVLWNQRFVK
jgi:hypothetical protein